jgi:hypothetical protein
MTMRKSHLAALLASLACFGGVGVARAEATEYVHHVSVGSGANYFGPFVALFASEVIGFGQGIGCAGIRGVSGVVCEPEPGAPATIALSGYVASEPYIHNHATFTSFYNGYYY